MKHTVEVAARRARVASEEPLALLRTFFGRRAAAVFEHHAGSVARILAEARSMRGPGWDTLRRAQALTEMALLEPLARGDVLGSPAAVRDFLQLRFSGLAHEVFLVIFLDAQNRLIASEEMSRGTLSQASVYPREVVKRALHHNAAALILSHCHPSGVAEPSHADEMLTTALRAALNLVDVKVLDHLVVAGSTMVSFAERGLL